MLEKYKQQRGEAKRLKKEKIKKREREQKYAEISKRNEGKRIKEEEEKIYCFDSNFFATVLPVSRTDLTLRIDNYFAASKSAGQDVISASAVGDISNGPVYNHIPLKNDFYLILLEPQFLI